MYISFNNNARTLPKLDLAEQYSIGKGLSIIIEEQNDANVSFVCIALSIEEF